jgi:DNA-binding NarL/FixJ family response regulator
MDFTPYLSGLQTGDAEERFLAIALDGNVALAMKGRIFLRAMCANFSDPSKIACAVTDEKTCLEYIERMPFDLLICTDYLEGGNGFELARKARLRRSELKVIVLALGDAIPAEYADAPWLDAVVAEADFVDDQHPLQAAVLAVMGNHGYRSPSLRSGHLPYLSCPRLTPREYEVLDLLASGMSDREMAESLVVSEETARTYTKRLLRTLSVHNRLQAVLKGVRCGMVNL